MLPVLSRDQIRAYDRLATEAQKIPGLILMENAGNGAAEIIASLLDDLTKPAKVCIVCGTGNNGGDGFVVARHLASRRDIRLKPGIFLLGDVSRISGDARINYEAALASGLPIREISAANIQDLVTGFQDAGFIIDAIFGTGLSRTVAGIEALAIAAINEAAAQTIALDIPSGLDANCGAVLGQAVRAAHTITFAYPKLGLFTPQANIHAGEIHVVPLGVPDAEILRQTGIAAQIINPAYVSAQFTPRDATTYKHRAGDILIVAGSPGKTGAAALAAEAVLRAGAGLSTICSWSEVLPVFEEKTREVMLTEIRRSSIAASLETALKRRSAIVLGPGFGLDQDAATAIDYVLANATQPVVVDADALTLCAQNPSALTGAHCPKILTPHAGELARLLKITAAEIEADRFSAAKLAAKTFSAIVVLKGAHTIVAEPAGEMFICAEANPALATAGSGDVLAGIIAAFTAAMDPVAAACSGVYVHAVAANFWSKQTGSDRGMIAGDIGMLIPEILGNLRGSV